MTPFAQAERLADKVAQLRILPEMPAVRFEPPPGGRGPASAGRLPVQPLYADATRCRRPIFAGAAAPDCAGSCASEFADSLPSWGGGVPTRTERFVGGRETCQLDNEGPVTAPLSTDPWETASVADNLPRCERGCTFAPTPGRSRCCRAYSPTSGAAPLLAAALGPQRALKPESFRAPAHFKALGSLQRGPPAQPPASRRPRAITVTPATRPGRWLWRAGPPG